MLWPILCQWIWKHTQNRQIPGVGGLTSEEIESFTSSVPTEVIGTVVQNLPTKITPDWDSFIGKFCQIFREHIITILYKLFKEQKKRGILPNSFYEAKKPPKKQKKPDTKIKWEKYVEREL